MANDTGGEFSKLEAGFAELKIERRRISIELQNVWRHATDADLIANDLDFNCNANIDSLPPHRYHSMHGILPALQYSDHLANPNNFAEETNIECFDQADDHVSFLTLGSAGLDKVLKTVKQDDIEMGVGDTPSITAKPTSTAERHSSTAQAPHTAPASTQQPSSTPETACLTTDPISATTEARSSEESNPCGRLLVFFVPLIAQTETSFGSRVSMQRSSVQRIFEVLGVNPEFLLNMLGRPDYWAPRTRWQYNIRDELEVCGMAYQ